MLDPAKSVIEMCGGTKAVAEMVGRSENRIRRWTYPKDRGGTGGLIPTNLLGKLISEAKRRGINLQAEHLVKNEEAAQ